MSDNQPLKWTWRESNPRHNYHPIKDYTSLNWKVDIAVENPPPYFEKTRKTFGGLTGGQSSNHHLVYDTKKQKLLGCPVPKSLASRLTYAAKAYS